MMDGYYFCLFICMLLGFLEGQATPPKTAVRKPASLCDIISGYICSSVPSFTHQTLPTVIAALTSDKV